MKINVHGRGIDLPQNAIGQVSTVKFNNKTVRFRIINFVKCCRHLRLEKNVDGEITIWFRQKNRKTEIEPNQVKGYYRTDNINEATYYLLKGGEIVNIDFIQKMVSKYANQPKVKQIAWKFEMKNVSEKAKDLWFYNKAKWNIRDFMEARKKLKILVYEQQTGHKVNGFIDFI